MQPPAEPNRQSVELDVGLMVSDSDKESSYQSGDDLTELDVAEPERGTLAGRVDFEVVSRFINRAVARRIFIK